MGVKTTWDCFQQLLIFDCFFLPLPCTPTFCFFQYFRKLNRIKETELAEKKEEREGTRKGCFPGGSILQFTFQLHKQPCQLTAAKGQGLGEKEASGGRQTTQRCQQGNPRTLWGPPSSHPLNLKGQYSGDFQPVIDNMLSSCLGREQHPVQSSPRCMGSGRGQGNETLFLLEGETFWAQIDGRLIHLERAVFTVIL